MDKNNDSMEIDLINDNVNDNYHYYDNDNMDWETSSNLVMDDMAGFKLIQPSPQNIIIDGLNVLKHKHSQLSSLEELDEAVSTILIPMIDFFGTVSIHLVIKDFMIFINNKRYKMSVLLSILLLYKQKTNVIIYVTENTSDDPERDDRLLLVLQSNFNGVAISNDKFRSISDHFIRPINYMWLPITELLNLSQDNNNDNELYHKINNHLTTKMIIGGPHDLSLSQLENCRFSVCQYQIKQGRVIIPNIIA